MVSGDENDFCIELLFFEKLSSVSGFIFVVYRLIGEISKLQIKSDVEISHIE